MRNLGFSYIKKLLRLHYNPLDVILAFLRPSYNPSLRAPADIHFTSIYSTHPLPPCLYLIHLSAPVLPMPISRFYLQPIPSNITPPAALPGNLKKKKPPSSRVRERVISPATRVVGIVVPPARLTSDAVASCRGGAG